MLLFSNAKISVMSKRSIRLLGLIKNLNLELFCFTRRSVSSQMLRIGFTNLSRVEPTIGFIGIGNMGSRMALNLLKARKPASRLFVFDKFTNTDSFREVVDKGAIPASSAAEISKNCDLIFTMVPASAHVRDLYFNNLLPSLTQQSLLIDCSTIDPGTAQAVQKASAAQGHLMIDAPVSGGIKGAADGTLTFMIGTSLSEREFENDVKKVFSPMGKAIYCGGPGMGQSIKICNNLILGSQMLGVAEGYGLAEKLGVDLKKFNEIVNSSTGQCWSSSKYNPVPGLMENVPASRDYKGGFMTDLMIKDLGLAVDAARSTGYALPVTEFSQSLYKLCSSAGFGALDFGSIFRWLKQQK
jgi:3-hydroxyisobutyrate dehydrogenase